MKQGSIGPENFINYSSYGSLVMDWDPAISEASNPIPQASLKPVHLCNRPSTAMAGWSALPGDLVNRIADSLLATDDLDCYIDLRAVCQGWRTSTADPKSDDSARFRPRQWAMLDEVHQSDARLFVNTSTGRFVRKDLPLLRRYFLVASAAGGLVVLAERTAPHAARVLNPFTGAMITFEAPVPAEGPVAAHVIGSSRTLVLLSVHDPCTIYWADPGSESFIELKQDPSAHPLVRVAHTGGIYAAARDDRYLEWHLFLEVHKILKLVCKPFAHYFAGGAEGQAGKNRCFLVESAGEMLLVLKQSHSVEVFKMYTGSHVFEDTRSNRLERVKNLGRRALFVGDCRCFSVDADKFASVEANCIYYVMEEPSFDVCVYSLKDEAEVRAGGAIDSLDPLTLTIPPPFSEVQLLCCHTFLVHQMFSRLEPAKVFAPESVNGHLDYFGQ